MRRFRPQGDGGIQDAISNFALTYAKVMLVFVVVLFALLMPEKQAEDGIKPKIEYLITMDWPAGDNDVDIWMQAPDGKIAYYNNKEAGVLNLERDDLGNTNNVYEVKGKKVVSQEPHQEQMSIRGKQPGEYIINVNLYRAHTGSSVTPIPVTIKVMKLNPSVKQVFKSTVVLTRPDEEIHVVRLHLNEQGDVDRTETNLPVSLIQRRMQHFAPGGPQ